MERGHTTLCQALVRLVAGMLPHEIKGEVLRAIDGGFEMTEFVLVLGRGLEGRDGGLEAYHWLCR